MKWQNKKKIRTKEWWVVIVKWEIYLQKIIKNRVAMFIRDMVDSPVRHNDEYSMRLTLNTSKASDSHK